MRGWIGLVEDMSLDKATVAVSELAECVSLPAETRRLQAEFGGRRAARLQALTDSGMQLSYDLALREQYYS